MNNTNSIEKDRSAFHAKCAVLTVCLCYVISTGIAWNTFSVYAEQVIAEFGILRAQFTLNMTIFSGVNAIMTLIFLGPLVEKVGPTKLVKIFPFIGALGFAIIALSKSLAAMYIGGALFGISACCMGGNINNLLINAWYKKKVGKMMGIPQTVGSIVGIIMTTVYGILVSNLGWRVPNWITCAVFIIVGVTIAVIYKGSPKELGEKPMYADEAGDENAEELYEDGVEFKRSVKHVNYWLLSLGAFIVALATYGVLGNLTLLAGDAGFSGLASTVLSVALVASAVCFVPAGHIIDRFGSQWLIGGSMLILIIAIFVLRMESVSLPVLYIAAAAVGASYDCAILAPGLTIKQAFGTKDLGKKLSIVNAFNFTGLALGPTVLALFYDMSGSYDLGWTTYIILAVVSAALTFVGVRRVKE
ncbi:MAG: MFS transporter [Oscillospiraceae bacterium]|nr:MFS transporter [Oscillospiraceae bacterium]